MGEVARSGTGGLAALAGAGFLMYMVNNVLMTLLPTYMVDLGCSLAEAGLQMTVFLVVAIALRFYLGPLADMRGDRLVMMVSAVAFAVPCLLLPWTRSFWPVVALRCVQAVGLAGFLPCASGAVSAIAPAGKTGLFIGIYRFATAASLLVGPVLALAVSEESGYGPCFWGLAACAAGAFALVALFVPREGKAAGRVCCRRSAAVREGAASDDGCGVLAQGADMGQRAERGAEAEAAAELGRFPVPNVGAVLGAFRDLLVKDGVVRLLVAATVAVALGYGLAMNFVVSYVDMVGANVNAGLFFTMYSAGGLVATPLMGMAADRVFWGRLVGCTLSAMGVGVALVCAVGALPWTLLAAGAVAGFGSSGSSVVIIAAVARHCSDGLRSSALALQQNALDLGIAVSSALFGGILAASVQAASAAFVVQGALMVATALFVGASSRGRS